MTADPFEKGELSRSLDRFTLADQVDQLVEAREADPDVGFMARLMTLRVACRAPIPAPAFCTRDQALLRGKGCLARHPF